MQQSFTDSPYKQYTAAVPADLVGKEGHIVEQVAGAKTIQLYTNGLAIGVLQQELESGSGRWTVRLLGKGGTVKVKAGGVIATPAQVKAANGGKVVDGGGAGRAIGVKTSPETNSADGDVIEIIDVVEKL